MAKQIIVMRKDLHMKIGKSIAQGAHGPLGVFLKLMNNGKSLKEEVPEIIDGKYKLTLEVVVGSDLDDWLRGIHRKIVLGIDSEEELLELYQKALDNDLPAQLVTDLGLTVFDGVKTNTCISIGPASDEEINKLTGYLKLL